MARFHHVGIISLFVLCVAGMTVLVTTFIFIFFSQTGVISFTGGGWLIGAFSAIWHYLGYSILFFFPNFLAVVWFSRMLHKALSLYESKQQSLTTEVGYYNGAVDILVGTFFGIGVLFTAWGMSNALETALSGISKEEAALLGAWGILSRLVDNGILIALWTTIVGGGGGYMMRLFKYGFFGRRLHKINTESHVAKEKSFFESLHSIAESLRAIESKLINIQELLHTIDSKSRSFEANIRQQ